MLKFVVLFAAVMAAAASAEETSRALPVPQQDLPASDGLQTAVLAGGCFWGMQGVFQHVKGVRVVTAGYSGGAASTARYNAVEGGNTGHAEAVRVTFDPHQVSYGRLLQIYFSVMDPTTLNRQGPDQGPQYRSEVFAQEPRQQQIAAAYIAQLGAAHVFGGPIVTRVSLQRGFYPAEDWHQDYLLKHPDAPYIVYNDLPKLEKLQALYPAIYRSRPVSGTGIDHSNQE
jgi:peptide-methionine (S)-S-oxide reductase